MQASWLAAARLFLERDTSSQPSRKSYFNIVRQIFFQSANTSNEIYPNALTSLQNTHLLLITRILECYSHAEDSQGFESIDGHTPHDERRTARMLLELAKLPIDVSPVLNGVFAEAQTAHCISNYSN